MSKSKIKLTTLCENSASPIRGILGEHGLSVHVETDDFRVLFDTGQTCTAVHNAKTLGIDLADIPVVLSHGHYDHAGGLQAVLEKTGPTRVYCHPDAFAPKYSRRGELRRIGVPCSRAELERRGAIFETSRDARQIDPGIWLTGEIPRKWRFEGQNKDLLVETEEGLVTDPLMDDQALVLELARGLLVICGCAHSGMINTLEHARHITGEERIVGVVGGFHMGSYDRKDVERTLHHLDKLDPEIVAASHCTGMRAAAIMAAKLGDKFIFNNAGTVIEI